MNKKSKFYNSKVILDDIIDASTFCNCINIAVVTDQNEIVENLREKDLETLIPSVNQ